MLYFREALTDAARDYAQFCDLQCVLEPPADMPRHALYLDEAGLALLAPEHARPFRLDESLLPRRQRGPSLLLRACGAIGAAPTVLDPFLGFGIDALQLQQAGCAVTGYERNTMVWLLARDFAQRMGFSPQSHCADAVQQLRATTHMWDVVYLDPMFPERNKKALPGLPMQHLRALAAQQGEQIDVPTLLQLAMQRARQRVVLKRRLRDPVSGKPHFQLKGQSVRFDVYT